MSSSNEALIPEAIDVVLESLDEFVARGRAGIELAQVAIQALSHWDEPHVVRILMGVADDPSHPRAVREAALAALCRLEAPEAIELLGCTLFDPDVSEETRCACADALGEIGNYGALEALEDVQHDDPDGPLAACARAAIANIRDGGA